MLRVDAPAPGDLVEVRVERPAVGSRRALVVGARALQRHAARCCRRSSGSAPPRPRSAPAREAARPAPRACPRSAVRRARPPGSASARRTRPAACARFHRHASCSIVRPMRSAIGRMRSMRSLPASTQPAGRKVRWSPRGERVAGKHVVVEKAAVVDDARDQLDPVLARRRQAQLARPRLERVEDDHRPVDRSRRSARSTRSGRA